MRDEPIRVWGLPLAPWTRPRAAEAVTELVRIGRPAYFITANTHYAMLSNADPRLRELNERAAFVVADGSPLVLASRRAGTPLPERVAGSDLIYDIAERAAVHGHRLFLLGGAPGIADRAAQRLVERYPTLTVAGTACPEPADLAGAGLPALIDRVRGARPDILLAALGQPKGELWLAENLEALGVPACAQVGATLDFVAGRVRRAPRWMQRVHMEWAYRMALEPGRLAPRYARNAVFLARMSARDFVAGPRVRAGRIEIPDVACMTTAADASMGGDLSA